jgi:hypothetical protein
MRDYALRIAIIFQLSLEPFFIGQFLPFQIHKLRIA